MELHQYEGRRLSNRSSGDSTCIIQTDEITSHQEEQGLIEQGQKKKKSRHGNGLTSRQILMRQLGQLLSIIVINIGLPMAIFYVFEIFTTEIIALIVSSVPPLIHVIYVMIRERRVDVLSVIFVLAFALSAALTAVSANARVAILRDSIATVVIAVMFLLTLIPIRTRWFKVYPITHLVNTEMMNEAGPIVWTNEHGQEESMPRSDWTWDHVKRYRIFHCILSFFWGFLLLLQFTAVIMMLFLNATIDQIILYSNIILLIFLLILFPVTAYVMIRMRKHLIQAEEEWRAEHDYYTSDDDSTVYHDHNQQQVE